jgi:hypothetical protein
MGIIDAESAIDPAPRYLGICCEAYAYQESQQATTLRYMAGSCFHEWTKAIEP